MYFTHGNVQMSYIYCKELHHLQTSVLYNQKEILQTQWELVPKYKGRECALKSGCQKHVSRVLSSCLIHVISYNICPACATILPPEVMFHVAKHSKLALSFSPQCIAPYTLDILYTPWLNNGNHTDKNTPFTLTPFILTLTDNSYTLPSEIFTLKYNICTPFTLISNPNVNGFPFTENTDIITIHTDTYNTPLRHSPRPLLHSHMQWRI